MKSVASALRHKAFCFVTPKATEKLKGISSQLSSKVIPNSLAQYATQQSVVNGNAGAMKIPKVAVKRQGCSGLSYHLSFIDAHEQNPEDPVVLTNDPHLKLIIDKASLLYLVGVEIDVIETEISSKFVFNNPNQKGCCGCGNSFFA